MFFSRFEDYTQAYFCFHCGGVVYPWIIAIWRKLQKKRPAGVAVEGIAIGAGGLGSLPRPVRSVAVTPTSRHRCDVSLIRAVLPRRWVVEMGPAIRYTLWRYTASTMKSWLFFRCRLAKQKWWRNRIINIASNNWKWNLSYLELRAIWKHRGY